MYVHRFKNALDKRNRSWYTPLDDYEKKDLQEAILQREIDDEKLRNHYENVAVYGFKKRQTMSLRDFFRTKNGKQEVKAVVAELKGIKQKQRVREIEEIKKKQEDAKQKVKDEKKQKRDDEKKLKMDNIMNKKKKNAKIGVEGGDDDGDGEEEDLDSDPLGLRKLKEKMATNNNGSNNNQEEGEEEGENEGGGQKSISFGGVATINGRDNNSLEEDSLDEDSLEDSLDIDDTDTDDDTDDDDENDGENPQSDTMGAGRKGRKGRKNKGPIDEVEAEWNEAYEKNGTDGVQASINDKSLADGLLDDDTEINKFHKKQQRKTLKVQQAEKAKIDAYLAEKKKNKYKKMFSKKKPLTQEEEHMEFLIKNQEKDNVSAEELYNREKKAMALVSMNNKNHALAIFERFDADCSGAIDIEEFHTLLNEMCIPLNQDELNELVEDLDADKSGDIDFDEFYHWFKTEGANFQKRRRLQGFKLHSQKFLSAIAGIQDEMEAIRILLAREEIVGGHAGLKQFRKTRPPTFVCEYDACLQAFDTQDDLNDHMNNAKKIHKDIDSRNKKLEKKFEPITIVYNSNMGKRFSMLRTQHDNILYVSPEIHTTLPWRNVMRPLHLDPNERRLKQFAKGCNVETLSFKHSKRPGPTVYNLHKFTTLYNKNRLDRPKQFLNFLTRSYQENHNVIGKAKIKKPSKNKKFSAASDNPYHPDNTDMKNPTNNQEQDGGELSLGSGDAAAIVGPDNNNNNDDDDSYENDSKNVIIKLANGKTKTIKPSTTDWPMEAAIVVRDKKNPRARYEFRWIGMVASVAVLGNFTGWKEEKLEFDPISMDHVLVKHFAPGTYQFFYKVDGKFIVDKSRPHIGRHRNKRNILLVTNPLLNEGPLLVSDEMNFTDQRIGDDGLCCLAYTIERTNPKLKSIDLTRCEISNFGTMMLSNSITKSEYLIHLRLRGNGIGYDGAKALSNLISTSPTLMEVDLGENRLGDDGTEVIGKGLEGCPALQTLFLDDNFIQNEGVEFLSESLLRNATLTKLSVRGNKLDPDSTKMVCATMRKNARIKILDISANAIGPDGAQALGRLIFNNDTLEELHMAHCRIGECEYRHGVYQIAFSLASNKSLRVLNLACNQITDYGAEELADALKFNDTLTDINMNCNHVCWEWVDPKRTIYTEWHPDGIDSLTKRVIRNRQSFLDKWGKKGPLDPISELFRKTPVNERARIEGEWTEVRKWKSITLAARKQAREERKRLKELAEQKINDEEEFIKNKVEKEVIECNRILKTAEGQGLIAEVIAILDAKREQEEEIRKEELRREEIKKKKKAVREGKQKMEKDMNLLDKLEQDRKEAEEQRKREAQALFEKKQMVEDVFNAYDADESGTIDHTEMKSLLKDLCIPMTDDGLNELMDKIDEDKSGEVEFDEFFEWFDKDSEAAQKQSRFKTWLLKLRQGYKTASGSFARFKAIGMIKAQYEFEAGLNGRDEFRKDNPHDNVCTYCQQAFVTKEGLKQHLKNPKIPHDIYKKMLKNGSQNRAVVNRARKLVFRNTEFPKFYVFTAEAPRNKPIKVYDVADEKYGRTITAIGYNQIIRGLQENMEKTWIRIDFLGHKSAWINMYYQGKKIIVPMIKKKKRLFGRKKKRKTPAIIRIGKEIYKNSKKKYKIWSTQKEKEIIAYIKKKKLFDIYEFKKKKKGLSMFRRWPLPVRKVNFFLEPKFYTIPEKYPDTIEVKVRLKPHLNGTILGYLKKYEVLRAFAKSGDWICCQFGENENVWLLVLSKSNKEVITEITDYKLLDWLDDQNMTPVKYDYLLFPRIKQDFTKWFSDDEKDKNDKKKDKNDKK